MTTPEIDFNSRKFDEFQQGSVPDHLYHYTNQAGLLGVLESGALWATKVQYLNDSTEFGLAIELTRERLIDRRQRETDQLNIDIINKILSNIYSVMNVNICTVSFCEDGDLLSQWRGYADGGVGFSISFLTKPLQEKAKSFGHHLRRCIYTTSEQIGIVDELIDAAFGMGINKKPLFPQGNYAELILNVSANFERSIVKYGACFKHEKFVEEKEWRIVTSPVSFISKDFRFRQGKSTVVPYYNLKLLREIDAEGEMVNDRWFGWIDQIVAGPCPHPVLAEQSLYGLVQKYGLFDPAYAMSQFHNSLLMRHVGQSKIPFRNW